MKKISKDNLNDTSSTFKVGNYYLFITEEFDIDGAYYSILLASEDKQSIFYKKHFVTLQQTLNFCNYRYLFLDN